MNYSGQQISTVIKVVILLLWGITPLVAIEYPYETSKKRRELNTQHLAAIKPGMHSRAVMKLLGKPDETTPLYEPKIKNPKQIGTTMWYILSQQKEHGSANDKKRKAVAIRLNSLAAVSRVDRINLPAETPSR